MPSLRIVHQIPPGSIYHSRRRKLLISFQRETFIKISFFEVVHIYNKWNPWKALNSDQKCRTHYWVFMTAQKIKPSQDFAWMINQLFAHQRGTQKQVEIWQNRLGHRPTQKKVVQKYFLLLEEYQLIWAMKFFMVQEDKSTLEFSSRKCCFSWFYLLCLNSRNWYQCFCRFK